MLNALSILIGLVALLLAIPGVVPFLGWINWLVLALTLVGAGLGALSRSNQGRNFCLVLFVLACLRLMLGGGVI